MIAAASETSCTIVAHSVRLLFEVMIVGRRSYRPAPCYPYYEVPFSLPLTIDERAARFLPVYA